MKFVQSNSGSEVALSYVNSLSLSWLPSHIYFSGVAGGRVKSKNGYNGHGILITTPSHLIIYNNKGKEIWSQPLETVHTKEGLDLRGIDLIRFNFDGKEINFGTGLKSRKKLVAHLAQASKESVNADEINRNISQSEAAKNSAKKQVGNNAVVKPGISKEESDKRRSDLQKEETARINPGKLVVEDYFAKTVRIYENGYVQVSGIVVGKSAPFEKLLGISSSYNHRGDDGYLTISTDQNTHALCVDKRNMDTAYIKRLNRLATAGKAVLESMRSRQTVSTNQPQDNNENTKMLSAADEIAKLVVLRDSGVITNDEFQILKNKFL